MVDGDAPVCERCRQPMWLIRVETTISDDGIHSQKEYQCKGCAMTSVVRSKRQVKRVEEPDKMDDVMKDCPL